MIGKEAKELAGMVLMTKALQLQAEYMGTCEKKITVHRVLLYITVDHVGAFFKLGMLPKF